VLLSLTEYGKAVKGRWSGSFLSLLRGESQKWKLLLGLREQPFLIEYIDRDVHSIRAQGVAGFLQVGDTAIEVRPQFLSSTSDSSWRRALWQISTLVEDEPYLEAVSTAAIVENEDNAFSITPARSPCWMPSTKSGEKPGSRWYRISIR